MLLRTAIVILPALLWAPQAAAQGVSTNVTCSADSAWMVNDKGQNPCLVSGYLSSVCNSGTWFVPTLVQIGVSYNSPQGNGATICRCNTVVYSLLQACSTCQGSIVDQWSDWITFCPPAFVGKAYPNAVPADTVIPGWATLDPTIANQWNATTAKAYAENPNASTSGGKKKSNVGPIVGGVIGGLAALAIAGFLIWFCMQRSARGKGQKVTPAPYNDPGLGEPIYNGPGYVEKSDGHRTDMGTPAPLMATPAPMRPYDPSDPSTFPQSPATTATYVNHDMAGGFKPYPGGDAYSNTSGSPAPFLQGYPPQTPNPYGQQPQQHYAQPGAYTGAAEV